MKSEAQEFESSKTTRLYWVRGDTETTTVSKITLRCYCD